MLKEKKEQLEEVFAPFTPIKAIADKELAFYGRHKEIEALTHALKQKGLHILLYGKRGIGKTSLGNFICRETSGFLQIRISLDRSMNSFRAIWKNLLHGIVQALIIRCKKDGFSIDIDGIQKSYIALQKQESFSSNDLVLFFKQFSIPVLLIIDEFDLVEAVAMNSAGTGVSIRTLFADLLKVFSDALPEIKIVLIGIASHYDELIGEHPSLQRCLFQLEVEKMRDDSLLDLIESGLRKLKLALTEEAKARLLYFSDGVPYQAQLITKYTAENALELRYSAIIKANFDAGIQKLLATKPQCVKLLYEKAIRFTPKLKTIEKRKDSEKDEIDFLMRENPYQWIVYAAALSISGKGKKEDWVSSKKLYPYLESLIKNTTEKTRLAKPQLQKNPTASFKIGQYLNQLCSNSRGPFFMKKKNGKESYFYFTDPLIKPYLLFELYEKGWIFSDKVF